MRRRTRKSLVNLIFFLSILAFILYLNRPQSNEIYAWTRIRYRTTSATIPPSRGICPGISKTSKPALVVSRVAADGPSTWLDPLKERYHLCMYTADAPPDPTSNELQVPANRGHEAMAYLTFIIDNYAEIPATGAIFVHGSRFAWHNDHPEYDNTALLMVLNVTAALAPMGYHNLRCDWSTSTCAASEAPPQGCLETSMRALLEPFNARVVSDKALPGALAAIFGDGEAETRLARGDAVRSQCCAQFVVARESIWKWNREEYVALRQWLLDGSSGAKGAPAPSDDRIAGRLLSYIWHILFIWDDQSPIKDQSTGRSTGIDLDRLNRLACPRASQCYCRLYGRCELEGCASSGSCHGQYQLPKDLRLPEDWAAKHP